MFSNGGGQPFFCHHHEVVMSKVLYNRLRHVINSLNISVAFQFDESVYGDFARVLLCVYRNNPEHAEKQCFNLWHAGGGNLRLMLEHVCANLYLATREIEQYLVMNDIPDTESGFRCYVVQPEPYKFLVLYVG